jgi:hypothetical protein
MSSSPLLEQTSRMRSLLLRANLPCPQDLSRLASFLHHEYLRQVNDPEKVLGILSETRDVLLRIAETLETHDSPRGGEANASAQTKT